MNVTLIITSDLRKKLAAAEAEVERIRQVLALYGGSTATASAPRKGKKRKLSPEQIAKMVAGRQASREAKAAGEAKPEAKAKAASLAEAAAD